MLCLVQAGSSKRRPAFSISPTPLHSHLVDMQGKSSLLVIFCAFSVQYLRVAFHKQAFGKKSRFTTFKILKMFARLVSDTLVPSSEGYTWRGMALVCPSMRKYRSEFEAFPPNTKPWATRREPTTNPKVTRQCTPRSRRPRFG